MTQGLSQCAFWAYANINARRNCMGALPQIRLGMPMETHNTALQYAGFWIRLAAFWLDVIVLSPIMATIFWANESYLLFPLFYVIPGKIVDLFYNVYLVQRFGGTPGKIMMRLKIRKTSGGPIVFREALLRYAPEFVFGLLISAALLLARLNKISDAEYRSLSSKQRVQRSRVYLPAWYKPLVVANGMWICGEFIVLLTNRKRRALHDFIAGTVVVYNDRSNPQVS